MDIVITDSASNMMSFSDPNVSSDDDDNENDDADGTSLEL